MTPLCMTPDELRLWQEAADVARGHKYTASSPCVDCPLSWARQMRAEGCCNGEPGENQPGRPILPKGTPPSHTTRYRRDYMNAYRTRNLDHIRERDRLRKRVANAAKRMAQSAGGSIREQSDSSPGRTLPLTET